MAKMVWVADDGSVHETQAAALQADVAHTNAERIREEMYMRPWCGLETARDVSENAAEVFRLLQAYFDPGALERQANAAIDELEREASRR